MTSSTNLLDMIDIEITNQQTLLAVSTRQFEQVARSILEDHGPDAAQISIAVVDDPTIHALNRQFLRHDYPTDVLSFALEQDADHLDGEVIVSAETALAQAAEYGVEPESELLLYVIHGVLHLVGFDDKESAARDAMRAAEQRYWKQ